MTAQADEGQFLDAADLIRGLARQRPAPRGPGSGAGTLDLFAKVRP